MSHALTGRGPGREQGGAASYIPSRSVLWWRGPDRPPVRGTGEGRQLKRSMPEAEVHRQRVTVAYEYAVCFTRHALEPGNTTLVDAIAAREPGRRHRLMAVVDEGVARAWPALCDDLARYCEAHATRLQLLAAPRIVPGGEQAKQSPELIASLHADMQRLGIDRQSFVLGIGGGAVLDAIGYAAATAHRGVRLVRMPTTVLGQNDSGVGVKNGINAFATKNFLGTFAPPFAVVNDAALLSTCHPRDLRSGMAEAVKVALIRDAAFFEWLEAHGARLSRFEAEPLSYLVRVAAEIHMRHIATAGDPFEQGSARPLDFGHWAAHKLESLSDHAVRHGEAVAIGIALDSRYSAACGMLSEASADRIVGLLEALGFTLWHDALGELDAHERPRVLDGLREFREHLGGELTVTLLEDIGRGREVHALDDELLMQSLSWLRARHLARPSTRSALEASASG
jgi:3-dehydroquinate synthase